MYENLSCEREHNGHQDNHDAPKNASLCGMRPFACPGPIRAEVLRLAIGRQGNKTLCENLRERSELAAIFPLVPYYGADVNGVCLEPRITWSF